MNYLIRELRDITGLTQKEFAKNYRIPLSTLQKWEQGESTPAPYIVYLIARTLPSLEFSKTRIDGRNGVRYYYDSLRHTVSDEKGNEIRCSGDPNSANKQNLAIYLEDLFEDFYRIQEKFDRDLEFDQKENIVWSRAEG